MFAILSAARRRDESSLLCWEKEYAAAIFVVDKESEADSMSELDPEAIFNGHRDPEPDRCSRKGSWIW